MKRFVHLICASTTGLEIDLIAAERERTTQKTEKDEKLHRGCERHSDRSGSWVMRHSASSKKGNLENGFDR